MHVGEAVVPTRWGDSDPRQVQAAMRCWGMLTVCGVTRGSSVERLNGEFAPGQGSGLAQALHWSRNKSLLPVILNLRFLKRKRHVCVFPGDTWIVTTVSHGKVALPGNL